MSEYTITVLRTDTLQSIRMKFKGTEKAVKRLFAKSIREQKSLHASTFLDGDTSVDQIITDKASITESITAYARFKGHLLIYTADKPLPFV